MSEAQAMAAGLNSVDKALENEPTLDSVVQATIERNRNVVSEASAKIGVTKNLFGFLRNLWPQATNKNPNAAPLSDGELFQAVSMIARYDLDPLTREIYAARDKFGRVMVVVGIDGWIKILRRTPDYAGHRQQLTWDENGEPLSCTTEIFSTQFPNPIEYVAYWKEYIAVGGFMKGSIPSHMLRIFSLRHAARQFAPIGGNVVTEAEARYMEHGPIETPVDQSDSMLGLLFARCGCVTEDDKLAVVTWAGAAGLDDAGIQRSVEAKRKELNLGYNAVLSAASN